MNHHLKNKVPVLLLLAVLGSISGGCSFEGSPTVQEEARTGDDEQLSWELIEELPDTYSYNDQGKNFMVRDQEESNRCWAFASLTALETSKSIPQEGSFDVEHLIRENPFHDEFEEGGAYQITMAYLLSWQGPVPEQEAEEEFQESAGPAVHVQEVRMTEGRDYRKIKEFVYRYGGVETSIYVDFDEETAYSEYYNEEFHTYCYRGDRESNHEVVIIGWDDLYPAENFVGDVTEDGAFLCQTSWGESFGNQGTFYVSYADTKIGEHGVVYSRVEAADNYDLIYQSDLCGFTGQIGYQENYCSFANVYEADEEILLRAAGFYATGPDTEYKLYAVSDFKDSDSFTEKEFVSSGKFADAGYYTVDFPEGIPIKKGKRFAIVVEIVTEGSEYPVAIESRIADFSEKADLSDGEGYLSLQGIRWENIEKTSDYNICLKGYADRKGE
ncbi:MAG: lectin like domain-containing protein [Lachnospiraceae bacterium]